MISFESKRYIVRIPTFIQLNLFNGKTTKTEEILNRGFKNVVRSKIVMHIS